MTKLIIIVKIHSRLKMNIIDIYIQQRKLILVRDKCDNYKHKIKYESYVPYSIDFDNDNIDETYFSKSILYEIEMSRYSNIDKNYFLNMNQIENIIKVYDNTYIPEVDCKILKLSRQLEKKDYDRGDINQYVRDLLENVELDWSRCYITGGCISNFIRRMFYKSEDNFDDVDIIVSIDSKDDMIEFRKLILNFIGNRKYKIKRRDHNVAVEIDGRTYDFFPVMKNSIYDTVLNFHFSCVRALYNRNTGLMLSPICLLSNLTMVNYIVNENKSISYDKFRKYMKRGYSFILNENEYVTLRDVLGLIGSN